MSREARIRRRMERERKALLGREWEVERVETLYRTVVGVGERVVSIFWGDCYGSVQVVMASIFLVEGKVQESWCESADLVGSGLAAASSGSRPAMLQFNTLTHSLHVP